MKNGCTYWKCLKKFVIDWTHILINTEKTKNIFAKITELNLVYNFQDIGLKKLFQKYSKTNVLNLT